MIVPKEEVRPLSVADTLKRVEPPPLMVKDELPKNLSQPPTVLHVFLVGAWDLPKMDYNWVTRKGSSDPQVTLKIGSQDAVGKSKVQMRTIEPVWNEHFALPCDDAEDHLMLVIEDYDMLSANDYMGQVQIPVRSLESRKFVREHYRITDNKGELRKKPKTWGTLELCLRWVHDPDFAFPIPKEITDARRPSLLFFDSCVPFVSFRSKASDPLLSLCVRRTRSFRTSRRIASASS